MKRKFTSVILTGFMSFLISGQVFPQTINAQKKGTTGSLHYADSLKKIALSKSETDYTVPSFTLFRKALISSDSGTGIQIIASLTNGLNSLQPKESPYSIVVNINEDPTSRIAFNWFTNAGITGGKVQIISGEMKSPTQFIKPLKTAFAKADPVNNLNYSTASNKLLTLTGIPDNSKKSYMSNKALVTGLKPNTIYSFRVGSEGNWSRIGTFKTAPRNKKEFSFIYTTDPQANTDEMFDISQKTTHAAHNMYPGASFWICCGDHVQSSGSSNSEWEWEQFFLTQQDILLHIPFAPVLGNHDKSANRNFTSHFNTDSTDFDFALSTTPGSVYSFVYSNTLFLALSFEDYSKPGYLEALAKWIRNQVVIHSDLKWRIVYYHKTIYTGSTSHQDDSDSKVVRDRIAPLFDSLKIDLALQGHDHIYEVIGPVRNKALVPGSVSKQLQVTADTRENVTGKLNGVFDVSNGTLYFLNNSAGRKKYEPLNKFRMDTIETKLDIKNYFGLFTGRLGQTGRPTYSNIKVTRDTITIATYEVSNEGNASLFDKIKLVK